MKLIKEGFDDLHPMKDRSPGVHVSDVIRDLCLRLGHFDDRAVDQQVRNMWELGSTFEEALIERMHRAHPDRYVQPGEQELDGLFGTPDLLDADDWGIHEIKLTWMSARHEPDSEKFWKYWTQIKSYCRMVNTRIGRLHVCHIMGDYRGSGPIYRVWEEEFSEAEIDENWRMIKSHADRYLSDSTGDGAGDADEDR